VLVLTLFFYHERKHDNLSHKPTPVRGIQSMLRQWEQEKHLRRKSKRIFESCLRSVLQNRSATNLD